jgi:hypothetical protein
LEAEQRVASLINSFRDPEAKGRKIEQSRQVIDQLVKIGPVAVPQLVQSIISASETSAECWYCFLALDRIGKPAVEPVRKLFASLTESQRWRLMPFLGKHDYVAAALFAAASLDSADENVRLYAIDYHGKHAEASVRPKLLQMLNHDEPRLRWFVINSLVQMPSDDVIDAFIALLDKNSWAAKGEGLLHPPGFPPPWWPDGRPQIIDSLKQLSADKAAGPMLEILREKGAGKGYLAQFIIPALLKFHFRQSIGELRHIAADATPQLFESPADCDRVKQLALEAAIQLENLRN